MSVFIGLVRFDGSAELNHGELPEGVRVYASRGGVELQLGPSDAVRSLNPIAARNVAALLVRASEEVERIRAWPEPAVVAHVPDRKYDVDSCSGGRR